MRANFERALWTAVTAMVAMLCGVAQAQTYRGAWDPLFGAPLTTTNGFFDLAWSGEALIVDVPAPCVPFGGTGAGVSGQCGSAKMQSATVKLFDFNDPTDPLTTSLLNFSWSIPGVSDLVFDAYKIKSLRSGLSDMVNDSLTGYSFQLAFVTNGTPDPAWGSLLSLPTNYSGPVLYGTCTSGTCERYNYIRADVGQYPAVFRDGGFVSVPEPGALALLAGAFLAAGLVRRSRRGLQSAH